MSRSRNEVSLLGFRRTRLILRPGGRRCRKAPRRPVRQRCSCGVDDRRQGARLGQRGQAPVQVVACPEEASLDGSRRSARAGSFSRRCRGVQRIRVGRVGATGPDVRRLPRPDHPRSRPQPARRRRRGQGFEGPRRCDGAGVCGCRGARARRLGGRRGCRDGDGAACRQPLSGYRLSGCGRGDAPVRGRLVRRSRQQLHRASSGASGAGSRRVGAGTRSRRRPCAHHVGPTGADASPRTIPGCHRTEQGRHRLKTFLPAHRSSGSPTTRSSMPSCGEAG